MLIDGEWDPDAELQTDEDGAFERQPTRFRDTVAAEDGADQPVESGRYHLYVSYACPWAHRTLIGRALLDLESHISVDVVDPIRFDEGWEFAPDKPGCTDDRVFGAEYLREIYLAADPSYTGRVTVPVLWDTERETIVNNESIEILRMLDTAFAEALDVPLTLYPDDLADEIDELIEDMYEPINNGVYRAGFAERQSAYDDAVDDLFQALDRFEARLDDNRFLLGERFTEADICLFTTLVRFDPVYHVHFKCSRRRIRDYPNLWNYLGELASWPAIKSTINMEHIRGHYYRSHGTINPRRLVATAPEPVLPDHHDRSRLPGSPPETALTT